MKKSEDNLRRSISLLEATLESTADGILVVDIHGNIVTFNQKFRKMWKIPVGVLENREDQKAITYVLKQLKDPDGFVESLKRLYSKPNTDVFDEIEFKDGRIYERYSIPQKMEKKVVGRVFSFRDVTERKQMEYQLVHQATHDILTGLPNRTLLMDRINQCIKYAKRHKKKVAILFLDLDRFKGVNDSLGHDTGDLLLKLVSERLSESIREYDTLTRWGGDEFVIVIPDLKSEENVASIIRHCMFSMEQPFHIQNHSITITCSMGISFYPKDGQFATSLLKSADSAMYHAKAEGKNTFQFYKSHMTEYALEQLELENDLHQAILNNQFLLYYQPIVDIKTHSIKSVEALIRWKHPQRGLLSPDKFIPLAEETGLFSGIGEWVLTEACRQLKAWHDDGLPEISIAVNVSINQFKQKDFLAKLEKTLKETNLDTKFLELEISETGFMRNFNTFLNLLRKIKEKGVALSIDDFGTGYSGLNYLKILPVDKLKIDKSFVQDEIYTTEGNIVLSVIALAKKLKLKVVAEGVETKEQYSFLKKHLCDEAQGYYFSRPVDAESMFHILKKVRDNQYSYA